MQKTEGVRSVGFFTIIDWGENKNCFTLLSTIADIYLSFEFWYGCGNDFKDVRVLSQKENVVKTRERTIRGEDAPPLLMTALHVISLATIIIPLIALIIKTIVRCTYQFTIVPPRNLKPTPESYHSSQQVQQS